MSTADIRIIKFNGGFEHQVDRIVREEPLEIFINGHKKYFCMRMPGMDYELALGLLYNEGVIDKLNDIESFEPSENRISFSMNKNMEAGMKKIYASSGSMLTDELVLPAGKREGIITPELLFGIQKNFFSRQKVFNETGAVHASAFYSVAGEFISFAEDVGRHNAVDKCMGSSLVCGLTDKIFLIMLSSRISFEMIRKSYRAGAAIVAGVSAPTSAAVNAACESGITLIGFLRGERFNIYTHEKRLTGNSL